MWRWSHPFNELVGGARRRGWSERKAAVASATMLLALGACIGGLVAGLIVIVANNSHQSSRAFAIAALISVVMLTMTLFLGHLIDWGGIQGITWWGTALVGLVLGISVHPILGIVIVLMGQIVVLLCAIVRRKTDA